MPTVPVSVQSTPNPAARKFVVGVPVGGPATFSEASSAEAWIASILDLPGVTSVFTTADFVTVSAAPDVSWDAITDEIVGILEGTF